jgi:hypothetical protein
MDWKKEDPRSEMAELGEEFKESNSNNQIGKP